MCGVVAAFGDISRSMAAMAHRGIRSRVADCGHGISLGHVRLPIVGLGEEHDQPVDADPWSIAFVGEILDYRTYMPDAACDLPLVVQTWRDLGVAGFGRFDGFWSVVAVNRATGAIHALVDYLAQKPLYYRSDAHAIAIASEPDAVAVLGPVTPDEVYFSSVVKWGYCPETWRTPYREIRKTLPGEYVKLRQGSQPARQVVDPLLPRRAPLLHLRESICEAVRIRATSSDVPVAALVSGGLDSAIVYALARRHADVVPYHVENGETPEARHVVGDQCWEGQGCEGQGCPYTRVTCPHAVKNMRVFHHKATTVSEALTYMQEPVDLGSLYPQVALSKVVEESVCLTGDGADELFGGYGRAARYDSQASDVWHELVGYHLPRLDRVMMRNRVEVRSPFLARDVAEMALGLPRELRTGKRVLRDLFRADLPSGVADQAKRPLRTGEVEADREGHSRRLVAAFRAARWPEEVR